jgi:hypothetical protein
MPPLDKWNGGQFLASILDGVERGMGLAMAELAADAKRMLGVAGGGEPSASGLPPHLQSGRLRAGVDFRVERGDDIVRGFLGVDGDVAYALRLELGFVGIDSLGRHFNQAPRPFLRPTLLRNFFRAAQIIAREAGQ